MKIINRIVFFSCIIFTHTYLYSNLLDDGVLKQNNASLESCFIYEPYLGSVKDIDNLDIKSDQFEVTDEKVLILNGNIELDFPDGYMFTEKARIDRSKGSVEFRKSGDIYLNNFFFRAEEGVFNKDNNFINLINGEAYLKDRNLILNFKNLNGGIDNKVILNDVLMTSCQDSKKGWVLKAESINLDSVTNRGSAKNVQIKILDRTVLKLPSVPFATSEERMTGFLEPSISYSSDGLDFMIPYFKVLSKESDITLAARNISERGAGLEGNFRKLHGLNSNLTNVDFLYFDSDKEYEKLYGTSASNRWAFGLKDKYQFNQNIRVDVDWSKASDSLVLRDISGEISSIGSERKQSLNQNITLEAVYENFILKIEQQKNQSLNPLLTNGYSKSPSIDLEFSKNLGSFAIYEYLNITNFKASELHGFYGNKKSNKYLVNLDEITEGSRIYSDFRIVTNKYFSKAHLQSSFGIKSIKYNLRDDIKTKNVNVPNFKLIISSMFIKKVNMDKHIIKPSLTYGFVDYKDQENNPVFDSNILSMNNTLFNNERFSGKDRIGDQEFYSLNFEYKKRHMNMDKVSLSISKQFFLKDRKVWIDNMMMNMNMDDSSMDMSGMSSPMMHMPGPMMDTSNSMMDMPMDEGPFIVMAKWMPSMKTMLMSYGGYFEDTKKMPMGGLTLKHKFKNGDIGLAKRYRRMSGDFNVILDYSEFFADLKINQNISLIAKFKMDDENNEKIESAFGLGYENCCLKLSITASDKNLSKYLTASNLNSFTYLNDAWDNIIRIENKSRINFQFQLKGLNSSFNRPGRLFNNSIFEY